LTPQGALRAAIAAEVAARTPAALRFLEGVVNMDSPTEDKALSDKVGTVFAQQAASLGFACERDPQADFADNHICRHRVPAAKARVLMVGHFDTVYAAGTVATRPFTRDGALMRGPGVLDMKGGLTVGLLALEALRAALATIPLDVTFVFNSDEEIGSPRSRAVIVHEAAQHDLALVLEPGRPGPAVTVGRKGVGIFRVAVEGREAHAGAEPENGINAIVEAAHKILAMQALNDWDAGTIVTPGVVQGGTRPYVVPGLASIEVDCRVATTAERSRVEAAMTEIVARAIVPGTRATLSGGFHRPPMELSAAGAAYVARLQAIARDVGYPLGTGTTGGASDGNLTAAAGTPTIDGLGLHGGRAHSAEEFAEVASLAAKANVLACFLADLAGT
jgi:glutamate carboxypeptidase